VENLWSALGKVEISQVIVRRVLRPEPNTVPATFTFNSPDSLVRFKQIKSIVPGNQMRKE